LIFKYSKIILTAVESRAMIVVYIFIECECVYMTGFAFIHIDFLGSRHLFPQLF